MNEKILQKLLDYLQNTEDFVLEQIPEIIQQAFKYEKLTTFFSVGLMILLLSVALWIGFYFLKYPTLDKYGSREIGSLLGVLIPGFTAPLFFIQLCYLIDKIIKMYVAPKYFLISLVVSLKNNIDK